MFFVDVYGFIVEIGAVGGRNDIDGLVFVDSLFNCFASWGLEFDAVALAALKDFDTVVCIWVMRGGDVDSEIEAHLIETIVDGRGGKDVDSGVLKAAGFKSIF